MNANQTLKRLRGRSRAIYSVNPYESAGDVKRVSVKSVAVACSMFPLRRLRYHCGNEFNPKFCSPRVSLVFVQSKNEQPLFDRGGGGGSSTIVVVYLVCIIIISGI